VCLPLRGAIRQTDRAVPYPPGPDDAAQPALVAALCAFPDYSLCLPSAQGAGAGTLHAMDRPAFLAAQLAPADARHAAASEARSRQTAGSLAGRGEAARPGGLIHRLCRRCIFPRDELEHRSGVAAQRLRSVDTTGPRLLRSAALPRWP